MMLTVVTAVPAAAEIEPEALDLTTEIDILGITDYHGRLVADGDAAGAAVLAGAVNDFEADNPNTLFVSSGDNIGASTFVSFVQDDEPTLDVLNMMGLDASALGNHEFDQGRTDVDDRVLASAEFPYLAANLYDTTTGLPAYEQYAISTVDGVDVGFIGAVTEDLPSLVSPAGISTLDVREILPEVNRVAAQLSDGNAENGEADVLVLLVHEGATSAESISDTSTAFGAIVAGLDDEFDAVFGGHTHVAFAADGEGLSVLQAGEYGEHLAHVELQVDPATGDVLLARSEVIKLSTAGYAPDTEVAAVVQQAVAAAEELGSVSLGDITDDFLRARQSGGGENRGGESTLGNLVADVQLWATAELGTEIAFMNPGGLRANLTYASSGEGDADGNVTFEEAASVQPFANTLVTMTLTGEQVVAVLEEQWQPTGASRPFLKLGVAGITYTYDPTAPQGERITGVWVGEEPLDLDAEYRVVANSFLASGGDNFFTLADGTARTDSGRVDLSAFVDYMEEFTPITPDLAQRAVGIDLVDEPAEGYEPGSTVTVNVSSLLFSAGEDQGTEVHLLMDGEVVDTATIDPTIVDTTDEVGRATFEIEIPADAEPGVYEFVVHVPSTDTMAPFWVVVAGDEVVAPDVQRTDFNGDGHPDVLARDADGRLYLYRGNGTGGWLPRLLVGTGWGGFRDILAAGDLNSDGHADVLARDAAGRLWWYGGNGAGGWGKPAVVGTGFSPFSKLVAPGDFDGDGHDDLMGVDTSGRLWLFAGNGAGGWLSSDVIGTGWAGFSQLIGPGDFSGDGNVDLLGLINGDLYLYKGDGAGGWSLPPVKVGTGFGSLTALVGPGDFSGDGNVDLLGRTTSGHLLMYRGDGDSGWLFPTRLVGSGWNGLTIIA